MGHVEAICISERKGTVKKEIPECMILKEYGLEGDAHAGSERQVSLLSKEKVNLFQEKLGASIKLAPGCFGENLLISGIDLAACPLGTRFRIGEIVLELMQIGKTCHSGCEISKITGECIMPREGTFARVLEGGIVKKGDEIEILTMGAAHSFTCAVLTASDRSFQGVREDVSGKVIQEIAKSFGYEVLDYSLLPDEEDRLTGELIRISDEIRPDVIFTTGGTGFSPRDRMPEATMRVADRNAPGIAEAIRAYSMKITPRAMLSRAVSVIRKKTLIINLPGSPKAVKECLEYLLPNLEHGILIMRGEADG